MTESFELQAAISVTSRLHAYENLLPILRTKNPKHQFDRRVGRELMVGFYDIACSSRSVAFVFMAIIRCTTEDVPYLDDVAFAVFRYVIEISTM